MRITKLPVAGLLLLGFIGLTEREPKGETVNIGSRKQLFLDDYVVESMEPRVFRLLNRPLKYHENPVIPLGTEWEQKGGLSHLGDAGNMFFDKEKGLFRFYGCMVDWDGSNRFLFYAESKDGIHWVKPRLGQVEFLEYDTNFIDLPFSSNEKNFAVFKDPSAQNPQEKYKMLYYEKKDQDWEMYPAHSADGIHWSNYQVDQPALSFYSDTNNNAIWDAEHKRYMLYLRTFTRVDRWFEPERLYPQGHRLRTPAWASSQDFLHWNAPKDKGNPEELYVCFHAQKQDPVDSRDFYTLEVLPYAGGYVGFTSVYHNYFGWIPAGTDSGKAQSPWVDRIDVQLLWSRDGKKFERVGQRRAFLANGPQGSWDAELIYTVQAPIVREERGEIWIYYEGFGGHHWYNQRGEHQRGQVGLAILRLDGFVSVTGIGALTTKALRFEGDRLIINATGIDKYAGSGYGSVRVEILDAETGQPFPAFTREKCDAFGRDELRHTVSWSGQADLNALARKTIKLRFHLNKAKLFSFQFLDAE